MKPKAQIVCMVHRNPFRGKGCPECKGKPAQRDPKNTPGIRLLRQMQAEFEALYGPQKWRKVL